MNHWRTTPTTFANSRESRKKPTDSEKKLWLVLRGNAIHNVHFRRQHALGPYVVDFCAPRHKLVIELDGAPHTHQHEYDTARTEFLVSRGYRVLRFWNHEVDDHLHTVLQTIIDALAMNGESR